MRTVDIFGVDFAVTDYKSATKSIIFHAKENIPFSAFALPVHGVIVSRTDENFKKATQSANLIVPDGQPVKWAMNFFHKTALTDRVYGPKLTSRVLGRANQLNMRVFLYGGSTNQVLDGFITHIRTKYPKIIICGKYREDKFGVETITVDMLRKASPQIVLVGLGCPKQEKWIARTINEIDAVFMGVGAAFSLLSGNKKTAPKWMQNTGLEWFYRLLNEPRRLWYRYAFTNSYFVVLVISKIISDLFTKTDISSL